jgi:HD superfamily phosphohydrolase/tRNA A-37 threonylcarbamoyl transferase component Bud32
VIEGVEMAKRNSPTKSLAINKKRCFTDAELDPYRKDLVGKGYRLLNYLGTGNWGEVYKVHHMKLNCDRAVKILLPKYFNDKLIKKRFLNEAQKMIRVSHNHIVNIFDLGTPNRRPYYIMEYIESDNLKKYLRRNKKIRREGLLEIIKQICNVLKYIHSNGIVHLDIKAENILVEEDLLGKGIKLADFGLAHYFVGTTMPNYEVNPDIIWMPRSLQLLRGKRVKARDFKPSQDLAYFGKMLDDVQYPKISEGKFTYRQITLLKKIIDDLKNEKFSSAREVEEKIDKLEPAHPSSGGIPEIASIHTIDSQFSIRLPRQGIVPLTPRLVKLIDLPEFQRLRYIKQLGPTSLIYPGATHCRFEHSLGAYTTAVEYLCYLLADPEFDYLFDSKSLTALLIAVLLHDIGHYPFAHQLEELHDDRFPSHRDLSCDLICGNIFIPNRVASSPQISEVIEKDFELDPDRIVRLIKTTHKKIRLSKEERILASFLDGALDVDKQDYLMRDSIHAGVEYGMHFDKYRLLRSLTISKRLSELAVTEKGKTAVEFLIMGRSAMFSEVYWHHTNRATTVMIQRAFEEFLDYKKPRREAFRETLLAKSDEELLYYLITQGPRYISDLVPSHSKFPTRRVYKRVITFAHHYGGYKERIYDALVNLGKAKRREIETAIFTYLTKKSPDKRIRRHYILLDIPSGDEKLQPTQIVFPNTPSRDEISLEKITHFDHTIFDQFFRHTKKARVYCHPCIKELALSNERGIRELIAQAVDVAIPQEEILT